MRQVFLFWTLILGGLLAAEAQVSPDSIEQYVFASMGDSPSVSGIELSFTLGEPFVRTFITLRGDLVLTQGFHQPDESRGSPVFIDGPVVAHLTYEVFPNPTPDRLYVRLTSSRPLRVSLALFDLQGRETPVGAGLMPVGSRQVEAVLDLSPVADGFYFLAILQEDGRLLKTFRVERLH